MSVSRTAQDYLRVPEEQLARELKPTGFYNQKTKAVRGAARLENIFELRRLSPAGRDKGENLEWALLRAQ